MALTDEQRAQSIENCPERNYHDNGPFRYCACGWMEGTETESLEAHVAEDTHGGPTDSEKLEFLYQVALKADKLMQEIGPQLIPMLEGIQKNPMLKMFLPRG